MNHLIQLVDKYETDSDNPIRVENISKNIMNQVRGIVGFQIEINEIQAAYKLSQGRTQDHSIIIQELEEKQASGGLAIAGEINKNSTK